MNTPYTVEKTPRFWLNVHECLKIALPPQDKKRLTRLRVAAQLGKPLPTQLFHSLEVLGSEIGRVSNACDACGMLGGSPAATIAMMIRSQTQQQHSATFIAKMAERFGGALPTVASLDTFERSWIIYNFIQANLPVPADLASAAADYFIACLGPRGASFTPGQLPDADNTAVVLCVLNALAHRIEPSCLLSYEAETCFRCYDGERNPSVTTNAHILEAFGHYIKQCSVSAPKYQQAIAKISAYLLSAQHSDGKWIDKWHASPYYATTCSVLALQRFGVGDTAAASKRAIAWILRTQRQNGSWGVWRGTLEETAYALQLLLLSNRTGSVAIKQAVKRGKRFLSKHLNASPTDPVHMQLWHGKELYEPKRVVRAAVLSVLYLCANRLNTQSEHEESLATQVA